MPTIPEGDRVDLIGLGLADGVQVWEQLPGEPVMWFSRFADFYLAMPGYDRSLTGAYRAYRKEVDLTKASQEEAEIIARKRYSHVKSPATPWKVNFELWRWKERAAAKDRWLRNQKVQERQRWLDSVRESEWAAAELLRNRAMEMLEYPIVTQTLSDDGRTIVMAPVKWNAGDAARYYELASKLGRMAAGVDAADPLEALRVLVDAGWVPDVVLEEAGEGLADLRDRVRAAFVEPVVEAEPDAELLEN